MKRQILIGLVLILSLGVTACNNTSKDIKDKGTSNTNEEQVYATDEELKAQNEKVIKEANDNIKYRIAKIVKSDGLDLTIEYLESPQDYDDRGYSTKLDIDISNLKTTQTTEDINLVGAESNAMLEEFKVDKYIRVGTYDSQGKGSEVGYEEGILMSVDIIDK